MSAVIGNGFAMSHCDLGRLQEAVDNIRKVIRPMARKAHAKAVAEQVSFMIDRSVAMDLEWTRNPLLTVLRRIEGDSRKVERTGMRDPLCDFGFEISFLPDPETNSIYGVMLCEHAAWRRQWMRNPDVRDFSWWNNSDRPSGVRASEWALRERIWDRLLPSGTYAEHSLTARISPTMLIHTVQNPLRFQPTLDRRRRRIASEILYGELIREEGIGPESDDIIQAVMKATTKAREPHNVARLSELAEKVRIPRRIDMRMALAADRPSDAEMGLT